MNTPIIGPATDLEQDQINVGQNNVEQQTHILSFEDLINYIFNNCGVFALLW